MSTRPTSAQRSTDPPGSALTVGASQELVVLGLRREPLRDLYHAFLTGSWLFTLSAIAVGFLVINALFAVAYWLVGGVAHAHGYVDDFFFSVQTTATIGYGAMFPESHAAHILVVAEAVVSLIVTALSTGLIFAKFSRAPARFRFSRHACIGRHHGVRSLMIRLGNQRGSAIVEAEIHVTLSRTEITAEGETFYRMIDLTLVRTRAPALSRSWTAIHTIDDTSPLYGATAETLAAWDADLIVSVAGTDEVTLQPVHARRSYDHAEVAWDKRHADLLTSEPTRFVVDLNRFDDVVDDVPRSSPAGRA